MDTAVVIRQLFISASHEDERWRQRLHAALDAQTVAWWDDSRLPVGSPGAKDIDAAITAPLLPSFCCRPTTWHRTRQLAN